uniref:Kaptin, actin binding protein n=1 Tax=Eptatretus burgeri TaxID=7764 RepID=A0A8C4Q449_EPTBU
EKLTFLALTLHWSKRGVNTINVRFSLLPMAVSITQSIFVLLVLQDARDKVSPFLNIYCDYEPGSEYNLDSVAQSCLNLALDFIPLQLSIYILVILLLVLIECHFFLCPSVLCLDVMNLPGSECRLTAFSCQNGVVSVSHVQKNTKVILQRWSVQQEGPVPRVQLCSLPRNHYENAAHPVGEEGVLTLDISLITRRDVLCQGLDQQELLPGSDCFDSVVCALVVDTDYNGVGEILLGTYGQELLCYKWHGDTAGQTVANKDHGEEAVIAGWKLAWSWTFHSPLLALASADVTGDGLDELIVVTTRGLHVLQVGRVVVLRWWWWYGLIRDHCDGVEKGFVFMS